MSKSATVENLDDYRWLVSSQASSWLAEAAASEDDPKSLLATTIVLRRDLGPSRTHLVIAQAQLRRRARTKFTHAERMFFTRQLLQQATDERIARYKSLRFPSDRPIADLCCGIGGDLTSLAGRCQTHAVDRDEVAALLAETNCAALGLECASFTVGDAAGFSTGDFAAWHLDPQQTLEPEHPDLQRHDPDLAAMEALRSSNPTGAISLAPSTTVPDRWRPDAELEWIGYGSGCRQQVAWFGDLTSHAGCRAATIFGNGAPVTHTIRASQDLELPLAGRVGRYLFEPHATVLAAELVGVVADSHGLAAVSPRASYLTGDTAVHSPEVACFEVLETLPFSLRRVRTLLRERSIGQLDVKTQGVRLTAEHVLSELSLSGDREATLLLMPVRKRVLAILCRRLKSDHAH